MKKCFLLLLFLLCALGVRAERGTASLLPDEVVNQFGDLYVFSRGRVCQLRNTCGCDSRAEELSKLFFTAQSLPLFPYALADSVIWLSSSPIMPAAMPAAEMNFVRNLPSYMQELYMEYDYETLIDVIVKLKTYQLMYGGDALPSAFVDVLDGFYVGRWNSCICRILMFLGFLLFLGFFREWVGDESYRIPPLVHRKICRIYAVVMLVFVSVLFAIRWVVGRHVPMTSGHEVMLFLVWCLMLLGVAGDRHHYSVLPTSLLAGLVAFIGAAFSEASISAIPATLDSPLLGFHVSIIIFSYAIFALMAINGLRGLLLLRKGKTEKSDALFAVDSFLLKPGVVCLALGIVLGSIWAKSAWGSYWSWDPKETWSLVTLLVYGLGLAPIKKGARASHIFAVLGFLLVLFTYFGVNYLLGGMHAYM